MRDQFAVPDDQIYLLTHSIGLMPVSSQKNLQNQFFDVWQSNPSDAWPKWLEVIDEFRHALTELFNGEAKDFCPQSNISSGLTKVLQSFPVNREILQHKKAILFNENDFPSVGFVLKKAESLGFETRVIPKTEDPQDISTWEAALTDDVYCVMITHSHYNTSKLIPVDEITRITRERKIVSIIDVAQSAGIVPIDFLEWQADIVLGSCIKWLCGGPGAGFLWVNPDLQQELKPIDIGWFSHQNPFEFNIHNFEYASDSSRFWGGTPSVLPYALAANSIKHLTSLGVGNIRQHNQQLTSLLAESFGTQNVVSPMDASKRGGTLVVKFTEHNKVQKALEEANIKFDARADGIRLSPHIYTTREEINEVCSVLTETCK